MNFKRYFDQLPEPFKAHSIFITKTFMNAGYECLIVGGPVRDLYLGISPKDIDFATNCPIEITNKLFKNVIPTGEAHGTVSIKLDKELYEVTRYRYDVSCDGRNATIAFADNFDADASRRDFTINACGYNPITNEFFDPTGGIQDSDNRIIRFVGDATKRIKEDNLRSIRFIRFLSRFDSLGFTTTRDQLEAAIYTYDDSVVSIERIYQELDSMFKILKKDSYSLNFVIGALHDMRIFHRFIKDDEVHQRVLEDMFKTFDYLPLLLKMKGDIQILKLSSEYKELYTLFITFQDDFEGKDFSDQATVKALLRLANGKFDLCERLLNTFKILNKENNHKEGLITLKALKNKVGTVDEEPYKISQLKVNGYDLINLGLQGTEIGDELIKLLNLVIENPSVNTREQLIAEIKNDYQK